MQCVVDYFGPSDFRGTPVLSPDAAGIVLAWIGATLQEAPAKYAEASPITHVTKRAAPVLFLHGDWDLNTPVENSLEIVKSFPKGRVVVVEQGGHVLLESFAQRYTKEWAQTMGVLRSGDMPALPERMSLGAPKFTVPDFPPPTAK